jgi:hypothetical protein
VTAPVPAARREPRPRGRPRTGPRSGDRSVSRGASTAATTEQGTIRKKLAVGLLLLACASAGQTAAAPAQDHPATIVVAPPTGDRERDRASIRAALDEVRPGGTVQFATGTYLVGELVPIETPRITLLGDPRGTTLRACDPDEYLQMELAVAAARTDDEAWAAVTRCGMFMLTGGRVTVRGFTFEYTRLGLLLGCCHRGGVLRRTDGGYVIEDNTFRNLGNGIRAMLDSPVPSVIRGNRFVNVFHALSAPQVSHLRFVANDISVPDPRGVPAMGYPSFAVAINALGGAASCEHNLVAGNRIEGHPIAIKMVAGPGSACRYNVIRDNVIIASRVPLPASRIYEREPRIADPADPSFSGVPLQLVNGGGTGGPAGVLENNRIEGNRVIGAQGLSILVWRASRNRIAENALAGVAALDPFPGNVLGFPYPESPAANGAGIWISPGSDANEIVGNTFADVGGHAVVLEGDRNRVEPQDLAHTVLDLGRDNRVAAPGWAAPPPHADGYVTIAPGVHVEVRDWGGPVEPLILAAGSNPGTPSLGAFAPDPTNRFRSLASSRSDFGASGEPGSGYCLDPFQEDVRLVVDTLGLVRANPHTISLAARQPLPGNTPLAGTAEPAHARRVRAPSAADAVLDPVTGNRPVHRAGSTMPLDAVVARGPAPPQTRLLVKPDAGRDHHGDRPAPFVPAAGELLGAAGPAATPTDGVVHVAPPTGDPEVDRAGILAAFQRVSPGGTVRFAPGTYLVGELIRLDVPRVTLLGDPHGTTLRGCEPADYEEMEWASASAGNDPPTRADIVRRCGMFELTGGHATVRGFTFEYSRMGLVLGCCHGERPERRTDGGYRIEDNTFRNTGNGIRPGLLTSEPTVIRRNRFVNTFHAISARGGHLHILDNDISVPEPSQVPGMKHPSFAVAFCGEHNVVAGNRIGGHPEAVLLIADPGFDCRHNVIRDNTIVVSRVPIPASRPYAEFTPLADPSDSSFVGVPLVMAAFNRADGDEPAFVEENLVERNRFLGAEGIAIEVAGASRNRIVDNTISAIRTREPFPGNGLGPPPAWRQANGAGIWISAGSEMNQILANTFEDVASFAVVLEGENNRVETRGTNDAVLDLGTGNHVTGGTGGAGRW